MPNSDRSKPVILPVRMSAELYDDLGALALLDQRNRCAMIRKLIMDAAQRVTRETPMRVVREVWRGR